MAQEYVGTLRGSFCEETVKQGGNTIFHRPCAGSGIRTFSFLEAKSLEPIIEIKNLSKTFGTGENQVAALHDVNLQIRKGDIFGIIGLSGAGKSTILRCINRMHDVTKGELTVDGIDVNSLKGKELRRYRRNAGGNRASAFCF